MAQLNTQPRPSKVHGNESTMALGWRGFFSSVAQGSGKPHRQDGPKGRSTGCGSGGHGRSKFG